MYSCPGNGESRARPPAPMDLVSTPQASDAAALFSIFHKGVEIPCPSERRTNNADPDALAPQQSCKKLRRPRVLERMEQ